MFKCFIVNLIVLAVFACSVQAAVLSDDFEDGVLDTSKWDTLEFGTSEIIEADGVLSMISGDSRPYLVTKDSFDPTIDPITVTGRVTLPTTGSSFTIQTRSSGDYDSLGLPNIGGVIGGTLRAALWLGGGSNMLSLITKEDGVWPWVNVTTSATVDNANLLAAAGDWDVLLVDDGASISMTVTNVVDPTNTGSISLATTFVPAVTSNKIVFGNGGASWDNITIVPEPASLMLLSIGALSLYRRRR